MRFSKSKRGTRSRLKDSQWTDKIEKLCSSYSVNISDECNYAATTDMIIHPLARKGTPEQEIFQPDQSIELTKGSFVGSFLLIARYSKLEAKASSPTRSWIVWNGLFLCATCLRITRPFPPYINSFLLFGFARFVLANCSFTLVLPLLVALLPLFHVHNCQLLWLPITYVKLTPEWLRFRPSRLGRLYLYDAQFLSCGTKKVQMPPRSLVNHFKLKSSFYLFWHLVRLFHYVNQLSESDQISHSTILIIYIKWNSSFAL